PDTFGFGWQLPQILRQGGIDYFLTQKLTWNDTNTFPQRLFPWQAPDGTPVWGVMTAPIGKGVDALALATAASDWEKTTGLRGSLWLPGVGDHGGGPSRDMVQTVRRWQRSPLFPRLQWTRLHDYLDRELDSLDPLTPGTPALTAPLGWSVVGDSIAGDGIPGVAIAGELIAGELIAGELIAEELIAGDSIAGESIAGDPIAGESIAGESIAEDPIAGELIAGELIAPPSPNLCRIQPNLSPWQSDLYLELHRGCYTSHGEQKWFNRRCEHDLYAAELWASLATLVVSVPHPSADLEIAWKKVLFNQFHDILPGSSIPEVYDTVNPHWQMALATAHRIETRSLQTLAQAITLPPPPHPAAQPWVVFNALNWRRSQAVTLPQPGGDPGTVYQIHSADGQPCPSQTTPEGDLLFTATVPPLGYHLYWLVPGVEDATPVFSERGSERGSERVPGAVPQTTPEATWDPQTWTLANPYLRVTLDPATGQLAQVWDQQLGRSLLTAAGNHFQFFQDQGQYWDAWNIDPHYQDHPLGEAQLLSLTALETGPVRVRVRAVWQFNQSRICQDYCLEAESAPLRLVTEVDWQETQVLLKVAFPVAVTTDWATTEIACGTMARPTRPRSPQAAAQWEVPVHRWADLSEDPTEADPQASGNSWGISLLNDCKYGYDCQPSQLRLTLLRSPLWPDPHSDRGLHQFTYALYSHGGDWRQGQVVRQGYALNQPLRAVAVDLAVDLAVDPVAVDPVAVDPVAVDPVAVDPVAGTGQGVTLGAMGSLLSVRSLEGDAASAWVPMAFKPKDGDPDTWILRGYDSGGRGDRLTVTGPVPLQWVGLVDGLEQPLDAPASIGATPPHITVQPWQICSLALSV
uniref:alpha-mannosidase n=1 Tax=Prochlorothrix hollandica TaxID=1223 RepID=UPI0033427302